MITRTVLIAHAKNEEGFVEKLAAPLRGVGYEVSHQGTVLVGESVVQETARVLREGGAVVLCGTERAAGNTWVKRLVNAARQINNGMLFIVQMEEEADIESFSFGEKIARYWENPDQAIKELLAAMLRYHPLHEAEADLVRSDSAEQRYREILLETCDIINLANLPEQDRHIAQKQQDLKLRGLYIPLRVQVEVVKGTLEPAQDQKLLQLLEERRAESASGRVRPREADHERKRVPVGERLAHAKRLVVLGDPGAGKTTLTRWITTAYLLRFKQREEWKELPDVKTLPDENWLPIIVRCRDLDVSSISGSLEDILKHTLRKSELTEAQATDVRALLQARLKDGQALLMLDGLDEINDPAIRAAFCQQLEQIVVAYPNTPIIATSRIVGYREMGYKLGRGFEHLTLADLTPEEKDEFARRWCNLTEVPERREDAIRELIHDIHSAERIERLTGNPMLLTTMALVKRKVGKLPNRRAELYWEAVQVLLNWRREVDEPLDVREAIPQLEYLAYAMCDQGVQQLKHGDIVDLFSRMREEYPHVHAARNRSSEEFLKRLEARTGILVEAGHVRHLGMMVPVYEFRHLTFQEYLAARALVDGRFPGRDPKQDLAAHVSPLAGRTAEMAFTEEGPKEAAVVENWREALRLCTAICNDDDVDAVLIAILTPLEGEPQSTARARAILAALCLADEPNASEQAATKVLEVFTQQVAKSDGDGPVKTGIDIATMELANTQWSEVLRSQLLKEFCGRAEDTRFNPGSLAGMIGVAEAPKDIRLTDWLTEHTRQLVNGNELEALKAALDISELAYQRKAYLVPELVKGLLARLEGSAAMSHAAALALHYLHAEGVWWATQHDHPRVISFLQNVGSDSKAVGLLGSVLDEVKDESVAAALISRLEEPDAHTRKSILYALASIESEEAIEPLIAQLEDADAGVRRNAAYALGTNKSEAAFPPLIARLKDIDAEVRAAAAYALGANQSESAVTSLIALFDDPEKDVRGKVIRALGKIKSEEAITPLIRSLEDTDTDIRNAAVNALADIGGDKAIVPLIAQLENTGSDVQQLAVYALSRIRCEGAVVELIELFEHPDANVRQLAVRLIRTVESDKAVAPLVTLLEHDDAGVRTLAAQSLGDIQIDDAIGPLIARLEDPDANVRSAAAHSLGNMTNESAVGSLIARLEDTDPDVRAAVARALGKIANESAVALLISRLDDAADHVRSAAARALGFLGSDKAVPTLIACLEEVDGDLQDAAAFALGNIKNEAAVVPLLARLEDADNRVQRSAARALGEMKNERAVLPLVSRLEDPNSGIALEAVTALGNIKSEAAVPALIGHLQDANERLRRAAAVSLGKIGSEAAIAALIHCFENPKDNMREMALEGLAQGVEDMDRLLLTRDLDGLLPFLDPHRPIHEAFVRKAASKLKRPLDEVRSHYEVLGERFDLRLEWQFDLQKIPEHG